MAIINGPKEIDENKLLKSITSFSKENDLTAEELDELNFICKSFAKFYNSLSLKENSYSPKMVAESFDEMLKNSVLTDKWSGLTTRANLFYKQVPVINKALSQDTLDQILVKKETAKKKEVQVKTKEPKEEIKKASTRSSSLRNGYCVGGGYSGPSC